jgi:ketosteroid isomerase-like protein
MMFTLRRLFSIPSLVTMGALSLAIFGVSTLAPSAAHAGNQRICSPDLKQRSAEQTIVEHIALLQAGRIDEAMCDYAEDATVILPNQVVTGLANIRGGLDGIGSLLGGAIPQVQTLTTSGDVVLLTFSAFGTPCTIPDGSDTYIVRKGKIVTQTVHDTFHNAPGAVCPLAAPGDGAL